MALSLSAKLSFISSKAAAYRFQQSEEMDDMMQVTEEEIRVAEKFFKQRDISILENQAMKINTAQPNFTATVLAMEMHGLPRDKVEDLLVSLFVIYYVYTELRKKSIDQISMDQLAGNIELFESFIVLYNKEKKSADGMNLSNLNFLKDGTVLNYAAGVLKRLFGGAENIPKEVVFPYFALLKAMEHGAEKAG